MSTSTAGPVACEPRAAFVLAGGAALGAMQAGMVHALYERGIAPDLLIGTSAGALNAAFLASRPATVATAEELAAVWRGAASQRHPPAAPRLAPYLAGADLANAAASGSRARRAISVSPSTVLCRTAPVTVVWPVRRL